MAGQCPTSYIIVGAGVFGASTAYHLVNQHPEASVTLIDRSFPCQVAASWDWNKVARADYEDEFYMEMALEAMDSWTKDALFSQYFRRTGVAWIIDDPEYHDRIIRNYQKFNRNEDCEAINIDTLRKLYGGLFADLDSTGVVGKIFLNRDSGLVQAREVLQAVIDEAERWGAKLVVAEVARLIFDQNGDCAGVLTSNNETLSAGAVILCTGAYTEKLMADSAPENPDLQLNGRLIASGVICGLLQAEGEKLKIFKYGPVLVHNVGETQGIAAPRLSYHQLTPSGEWMPPTADGLIKFNRDLPWRNTQHHEASGKNISAPPPAPDYGQWSPSEGMKREVQMSAKGIFGSLIDGLEWETYRQCWDAVAPDSNFLISPLPGCRRLYFATGGSFHGWKFLPMIGKYIVRMLDGELGKEHRERWSWDRPLKGPKGHTYQPTREWKDL